MNAKRLSYVDRTARGQQRPRPRLGTLGNPSVGTTVASGQTAAPRRALVAFWRRSPLTGRLEMRWQTATAAPADGSDEHPAAA